jgi:hypothetical protein
MSFSAGNSQRTQSPKPLLYTIRIVVTIFPNTTFRIGIGYGCVPAAIAVVGVGN